MRRSHPLLLGPLVLLLTGCGGMRLGMGGGWFSEAVAGKASDAGARAEWIARRGGIDTNPVRAQQAKGALARLRIRSTIRSSVKVLASDRPCAYAWPNGSLFVTRGLVDLLAPDELAAALAHEVGHLLPDGGAVGGRDLHVAALGADRVSRSTRSGRESGRDDSVDLEIRADLAGVEVLLNSGMSSAALAKALTKVRDAPLTPPGATAGLTDRINRLAPFRPRGALSRGGGIADHAL